jgi:protein TonB
LLLHAVAVFGFLLFCAIEPKPSSSLPQIELLPMAAEPVLAAEAKPSPADVPIADDTMVVQAAVAAVQPAPKVIVSKGAGAETAFRRPEHKNPLHRPEANMAKPQVRPEDDVSESSEASALATSGRQEDRLTVLSEKAASVHAGPPPTYIGMIRAKLEREKHYPPSARMAGEEGVVRLRFSLNRAGEVLDWKIEQGSVSDALNEEVGRMIRHAAPFHPFPDELQKDRLTLVVPVEFSLAAEASRE